eukprot:CAMPEP_0168400402 /NCGR_PEP_ID=MMETSP0228-20121227/22580_1 /TAXON_ID=133427 /ORGANISM="Protoceratium reticulatum, Strain CCCM 535 (=CCMP 1889)" /LENGTH=422 /DNA_ID=CAMNT_0008413943 /DNA_START=91 /DNA_END=1356 /DNA_ORIENTATION=+
MTPYAVAWEADFEGLVKFGTLFTLSFWSLDILLNFRTGFYRFGELELRPGAIARRYARTWLLPDLLLVLTDLVSVISNLAEGESASKADGVKVLRVVKAGRILRILGVIRMAHFFDVISRIVDKHQFNSDTFYFGGEVAFILLTILWLNHVVCCGFYLLGRAAPSDTGITWLDMPISSLGDQTYAESGFWYQYLTALHWSVSQMTPGSMQVSPVNSLERQFNIVCLIFGMIIFTTLVSSLSAKMMHVKMQVQDQKRRLMVLRNFLRSSPVSSQLAVSVQKQAAERLRGNRRPLTLKEVPAIGLLSLYLRTELQLELCWPQLQCHPLLRVFEHVDNYAVRKLCREAVEFLVLSPGDSLFQPGHEASAAYVLSSGKMSYTQEPSTSPVEHEVTVEATAGQWLCEAALWSFWLHVGTAEAASVCE